MSEKYVIPIEAGLLRAFVRKEDDLKNKWSAKWDWILDEYKALKETIATVAETSVLVTKGENIDPRTIQPIPESVNHEYGWLATKPEFNLEVYGHSLFAPKPLPLEYRLIPRELPPECY